MGVETRGARLQCAPPIKPSLSRPPALVLWVRDAVAAAALRDHVLLQAARAAQVWPGAIGGARLLTVHDVPRHAAAWHAGQSVLGAAAAERLLGDALRVPRGVDRDDGHGIDRQRCREP